MGPFTSSSKSAEHTGDFVRNLEVNSFFIKKKENLVVHMFVIDMRSSIYYTLHSKLVRISSDT